MSGKSNAASITKAVKALCDFVIGEMYLPPDTSFKNNQQLTICCLWRRSIAMTSNRVCRRGVGSLLVAMAGFCERLAR